jgi:phage repressor protein C with HTH and peptisase S24 domain
VAAEGLFAEDQGVAGLDLKAAAARGQQGQALDVGQYFGKQLVRQTGGAWGVVSLHAKFDADGIFAHDALLSLAADRNAAGGKYVTN